MSILTESLPAAPDSHLLLLQEKEVPGDAGEVPRCLHVAGTARQQHGTGGEAPALSLAL